MSAATPLDLEDDDVERGAIRGQDDDEQDTSPAIIVTVYDREDRPRGRRITTTWDAWVYELEERTGMPRDDAGPGWSPGCFVGDHRAKKNVEKIFAIGLDLEPKAKGEPDPLRLGDPEKVVCVFGEWLGYVHSTRSSRPDAPRSRLVLVTDRPMSLEEYTAIWPVVSRWAEQGGLRSDPAPKDASRLWYYGCDIEGGCFSRPLYGRPLPVDELLDQAAREAPPPMSSVPSSTTTSRTNDDGPARYARRALESAVGRLHMAQSGERNDTLAREAYGVAQAYRSARLPMSEARPALRAAIAGWDPAYMPKHEATLDRQLEEGAKVPRSIPDRRPMSTSAPANDRGENGAAGNSGTLRDGGDDDGPRERRVIQISTEVHRNVDDAISALADGGDVYQREGVLVHVARLAEDEGGKRRKRRAKAGTPRIYPATPGFMGDLLTKRAVFESYDRRTKEWNRAVPPGRVVAGVLERRMWRGIEELVAITETPILHADGTVHDRPGLDLESGYLYLPTDTFAAMPAHPTRDDARRALRQLEEVFVDFPFAAPAQRAVPIAALLTLVGRAGIEGATPAFVFDSSMRGAGKTLQANVISEVAFGRGAPLCSWPAAPEEQEKLLAAVALQGDPLLVFDNAPTAAGFGGPALDKCLTCTDRVQFRILGKSEAPTLPWRTPVFVTANNISFAGDTSRRCLVARLEPDVERPEERTDFRHPDLAVWARVERRRLVPAVLTLLRAYILAGRPDMGLGTWGSFEAWAALVPPAIVWAGGANVLDARAVSQEVEEPELVALAAILEGLPRLADLHKVESGMTAKHIVEVLYPSVRLRAEHCRDAFESMREAIESLVPPRPGQAPDPKRFSYQLRAFKGRPHKGKRLVAGTAHGGAASWTVGRVDAR